MAGRASEKNQLCTPNARNVLNLPNVLLKDARFRVIEPIRCCRRVVIFHGMGDRHTRKLRAKGQAASACEKINSLESKR